MGRRSLYLVVRNPGQVQIRVTSISVSPNLFQVWGGDSVRDAINAVTGVKPAAFIDGEAEKRFPINLAESVLEENGDILCRITVWWRSMRHEHIPCIPVTHRKTPRTMKAQQGDEL